MADKKFPVIYTSGSFDIFHKGHLNILKKAKEIANYLIVGVSTDELIKEVKGRYPVFPLKERMMIVEAIKYVDKVIIQRDLDKQKVIDRFRVNAIVVGSDWKDKYPSVSCEMVYFPYTKGVSSSSIKERLVRQ